MLKYILIILYFISFFSCACLAFSSGNLFHPINANKKNDMDFHK